MSYKIPPTDIHAISCRLHKDDFALLQKVLLDEELTFQDFVRTCAQAMIDGNPRFLKILEVYRDALGVKREKWEGGALSQRERIELLKRIEEEDKKGGGT